MISINNAIVTVSALIFIYFLVRLSIDVLLTSKGGRYSKHDHSSMDGFMMQFLIFVKALMSSEADRRKELHKQRMDAFMERKNDQS